MSDASPRLPRAALLVAFGGVCGAVARYGIGLAVSAPLGTLAANVAGSVILGGATASVPWVRALSERTRLVLATGFLSSLTTYSTFAVEVATSKPAVAVAYVVATYALGFGGVFLGRWLVAAGTRSAASGVER